MGAAGGPPDLVVGRSFGNWQSGMTANRGNASTADPFDGLPLLIPVPQAAKLLGISRAAAYRFASAGDLPTIQEARRGGRAARDRPARRAAQLRHRRA